jgi:surface polysaccharide O-acyltransferase-like enzyme
MIVSLLGLGQKLLDRPSRALSYLTQAIFPYYILHQTIIILVAYPLIDLALPAWAEASVIVMATVVACATLYEFAIRRMPLLCVLFGLKFRRPVPRLTHLAPATRL